MHRTVKNEYRKAFVISKQTSSSFGVIVRSTPGKEMKTESKQARKKKKKKEKKRKKRSTTV